MMARSFSLASSFCSSSIVVIALMDLGLASTLTLLSFFTGGASGGYQLNPRSGFCHGVSSHQILFADPESVMANAAWLINKATAASRASSRFNGPLPLRQARPVAAGHPCID